MDVVREIEDISLQPEFQKRITTFLEQICSIDTSTAQELSSLRDNEHRVFRIIETQLKSLHFQESETVFKEISPVICDHPSYSIPYYAFGAAEEVYEGRHNLLYMVNPTFDHSGRGTALNAHIDTVPPYFSPSLDKDVLSGRGSADDKGNIAVIIGTLIILDKLLRRRHIPLKNRLTAMFVIDEEMGGNGSLDLAIDKRINERYDSILVLECTDNNVHPANRGAVFIKCEGIASSMDKLYEDYGSIEEAFAFGIIALLEEGEKLKRESSHPLFPHRPVQTCTGILGPFGEHPSAICGRVEFILVPSEELPAREIIEKTIERGIEKYTDIYGDKTRIVDPDTGCRKLIDHYQIRRKENTYVVKVMGTTGHMGSLSENDAAIAKWAYIAREFIEDRLYHRSRLKVTIAGKEATTNDKLVFEGAQGFLPTHSIEEIKTRTENAFRRGIETYLCRIGADQEDIRCDVSFNKLHNDAYAGNPDSRSVQIALRVASQYGLRKPNQPVLGWDVSCDARLFANEHPQLSVITFGAGKLKDAHSDSERVVLSDIFRTICASSLFVLAETGTIQFEL
jgi:acetylornithine deacetylase/succinyl-diaminopimelate desuccinylase-like protein